jgi:hypothetical protein
MEEVTRRIIGEVDSPARDSVESAAAQDVVASTASLAVGAQELSFSWSEPFADANYSVSLFPLADPGAALRIWIKSKSTTKIVFGVAGHTNAVSYSFVAK